MADQQLGNHHFSSLGQFRRHHKAQSAMEFALVLPLLILLLYGIIEFGRLLLIYNQINTASRESARWGSATGQGITANTPRYADCAGIKQIARTAGFVVPIANGDITIQYDHGPGTTASSGDCSVPGSIALGDRVLVTVSATYSPILPIPYLNSFPITSVSSRSILTTIDLAGVGGGGSGGGAVTPQVYFGISSASANENEGTFTLNVVLSSSTTNDVTVSIGASGTAVAGTNYSFSNTSVTIPAGTTTKQISINLIDDTFYDTAKTVILTLSNPSNATLGSPSVFTLTLLNIDPPPIVSFQYSTSTITETGSSVAVAVLLKNSVGSLKASKLATTINFGLGGTAVLGANYNLSPISSLTIPAGSTSGFIVVTPINNNIFDTALTVILTISGATNGDGTAASLGSPTVHTVTIRDNNTPTINFSVASLSVDKSAGTAKVQVLMSTKSSQTVSVPFTIGGTAASPAQYTLNPANTVTFSPGATSADITFSIVNNPIPQGSLTVKLTLGTPTLGAKLGSPSVFTLTITETYTAPSVSFSYSSASVNEGQSTTLNVNLTGYANAPVTVPFSLSGTAINNTHYTVSPAGSITIPFGQLSASITISTIIDPVYSGPRTIILTMGAPSGGGVTKGSPNVSTVTIVDLTPVPTIYFNGVSNVVAEDAGTVSIPLKLSGPAAAPVTVTFKINAASSAIVNTDYTPFSSYVVTFAPNTVDAVINVAVLQNPTPDLNPRTLIVDLVTPVTVASIGSPSEYTLTIRDNQICPRFASIAPSRLTSKLTLYLANDRQYATNVFIQSITVSTAVDPSNIVSQLSWLDSVPADTLIANTLVGNPIAINSPHIWTLAITSPPAPLTGYRLLIVFGTVPTFNSAYTVSITYSNNCIRTTTAIFNP